MKAILTLIASVWMTTPAHAVTFNCQGADEAQGTVQLQCDDFTCVANGAIKSPSLTAEAVSFANCGGTRRPETTAKMYQTLAYYDVSDKQCWASYIRVGKNFDKDGSVFASIVSSKNGPIEDYSGYEYISLKCELQN